MKGFPFFQCQGLTSASLPRRPYLPSFLSLVHKPPKLWASVLRIGTDFENLNFMLNLGQLPIFLGLVSAMINIWYVNKHIENWLSDYHPQAKHIK